MFDSYDGWAVVLRAGGRRVIRLDIPGFGLTVGQLPINVAMYVCQSNSAFAT